MEGDVRGLSRPGPQIWEHPAPDTSLREPACGSSPTYDHASDAKWSRHEPFLPYPSYRFMGEINVVTLLGLVSFGMVGYTEMGDRKRTLGSSRRTSDLLLSP